MGISIDQIKDPALRRRILDATGQITTGGMVKPCPKAPRRLRQDHRPLLNELESQWLAICQSAYPSDCLIVAQGVRFRLGNGIWYKPDVVVFGGQVYAYEVKGPHVFRGGFENLKVAAHLYPQIRWSLVWKEERAWREQEILP